MNINLPKIFGSMSLALIFLTQASHAWAHCGGNHGPGHPHCNGGGTSGGDQDPVFTVESLNPYIPAVDSYSFNPGDVITYRGATVDLTQFVGTRENGDSCNHGVRTGTLSTRPKSSQDPDIAVVRFGFRSELDSGLQAHHVFIMEGVFDDNNYPPAPNTSTSFTLEYWEYSAEQRKAQKEDCAGDSPSIPDPAGPWSVTITGLE